MSENTAPAAAETPAAPKAKGPKGKPAPAYSRKTLRKLGRDKRKAKILGDREHAKKVFEAKSKRSVDKKSAYRKKKKGKK